MINKLVTVAALSALTIFGQGPGGPGGPGRPGGGTPPSPEQMIERRIEHLTTLLTLTPSQVTQAKTIFTDEQKASETLRSSMETAHKALETAVKSNATDPQIDAAAAEVGRVHGQISAVHAKAQTKFRAILNADQQTKLDSMPLGPGGGPHGGPGMRRGMGRM